MALKSYNPVTPSLRHLVTVDRSELWKGKPVKALTEGLKEHGGRNNSGRITMRRRGGGHKQRYRIIDFKRTKDDAPATASWPTSSRRSGCVRATASSRASGSM